MAQLERPSGLLEQPARLSALRPGTAARPLRPLYCSLAGDIISVLPSPLPSPIRKACAPCACFLFVANVCFPLLNHAYWAFSCSKRQLLLEFLFFILTFQKKALSLHPQRIQYSRISSLSLESVVVYPTISAQGYTWRPVSLGLSRRRAHLSARKGGPFFFSASILETIWNHLKLSGTIWNYLELFGTALGHLDRPQGNWNSRRLLERPKALERPLAIWNARRAIGTALRASGTEPSALPGTRLALRDYSNPPSSLPLLPLLPESEPKGKGASTITYKKSKSCS